MLEDNFLERFMLSLFNENTRVTTKQLMLISQGKRTPSVLFNVEKNKLYSLFSLYPELVQSDWEKAVQSLLVSDFMNESKGVLTLTDKGSAARENFSKIYPFTNDLTDLEEVKTRKVYWNRFLFMTQILSEYSYENKQYYPYLSSLEDQVSVKKWLLGRGLLKQEIRDKWVVEVTEMLHSFSREEADFIVDHFIGHNHSGMTTRQLREKYSLDQSHYLAYINNIIRNIKEYSITHTVLLRSLWKETHRSQFYGLSNSAWITQSMLEKGMSIEKVARQRRLKENTIKEHILESVLILNWQGYQAYIPPDKYLAITQLLDRKSEVTFSEAKSEISDLEFFWFRLIEIERARGND